MISRLLYGANLLHITLHALFNERALDCHILPNIGNPSIRNLFSVSRIKSTLWFVLAASSFLHMVWNSAVFQSFINQDFAAVTVFENFTQGRHGVFHMSPPGRIPSLSLNHAKLFNGVNDLQ